MDVKLCVDVNRTTGVFSVNSCHLLDAAQMFGGMSGANLLANAGAPGASAESRLRII